MRSKHSMNRRRRRGDQNSSSEPDPTAAPGKKLSELRPNGLPDGWRLASLLLRSGCRSDPREDLQSKSWGQETVRPPRAPGPGRPGLAGIVSAPLSRDLRHAFSRERGETVRGQTASMTVKGPKHFSQDIGNLSHAGPGSHRFHDQGNQVLFTGSRGLQCTQSRLYPGAVAL